MPSKPPIDRQALRKAGLLNESHFFRLMSEQNNYMDEATLKEIYMGMVRAMTAEIKKNGMIRLPHLGDFALVKQKDRLGLAGKVQKMIRGKCILKFYALDTWRFYFNRMQESKGNPGTFDPRTKALGQKLD